MLQGFRDSESEKFGKDYFDSGKGGPGTFDVYSFDEYLNDFKPLSEIIVKHFGPQRILDIGCAKGAFVCAFRELGVEAFGVDVSKYAISCAPSDLEPFLLVVDLNKDSLPFSDNYFDFITFFGSIEYLRNHRHAVSELERVIVKGGSMLLTTIHQRPKGDFYRINVHGKAFWLREFGARGWRVPEVYVGFMSDYFRKRSSSSVLGRIKRLLFGRSTFSDGFLVFLWDTLVRLRVLTYGVILLTFHKSEH